MKSLFSTGSLQSGSLVKSLLFLALLSPLASAKVVNYRYYRFHVLKVQGNTLLTQLSEMQFFNGATAIPSTGVTVTDPTGNNGNVANNEGPASAFDNNTATKWLNYGYTAPMAGLVFDFGKPTAIDSYNYVTGNDQPDRDPISWMIEGSLDQANWDLVDVIYNTAPNPTRKAPVSASNFIFPDTPNPVISSFDFSAYPQPAIIVNGTSLDFYAEVPYANSVNISNSSDTTIVPVPDPQYGTFITVNPPDNKDTVYTLNAISGSKTTSQSIPIRTTQKNAQNFRYVRYRPVKTRSAGTTVTLNEFTLYNGSTALKPTSATSSDSKDTTAPNLIDGLTTKSWSGTTSVNVVFDLGATSTFDGYSFATAADTTQVPVQWVLDGSNDKTNWTLIDNVTSFDYPTLLSTDSGILPTPGASSSLPYILLTGDSTFSTSGEAVKITYLAENATSLKITPEIGATGLSGTVIVRPTATTTYTATTVSTSGITSTKTFTVQVTPSLGSINYPNFETSSDLNLVGPTVNVLNDFAAFPNSPNAKRLRLTDIASTYQTSAAWSLSKMKVSEGFQTSFDVQMTYPVYVNGADGIAFIVQNSAQKFQAPMGSGLSLGTNTNSVAIALDTYSDAASETQANLKIVKGPVLATDVISITNLDANGAKVAKGYKGLYMTTQASAAPYHVDIVYTPGAMSVWIDSKLVADRVAVDLSALGAYDVDGKAYLGFGSSTKTIVAYQDVLNWTFTSGSSATVPLAVTNSAFTFGASPQLALTFNSTSGKTYRVTQSTDLVNWTAVGSTVVAAGASTNLTVPFTAGAQGYFRVEQVN